MIFLPTKVIIGKSIMDSIYSHASSTFPEECCGLLFGIFEEGVAVKRVNSSMRMDNVFEEKERYHRYTIDPKKYLIAEIDAQKRGEEVVGIYHAHPNAPAKPSQYDQNHAWPTLSYIIVEVREAKPLNVASWQLKDDRSEFIQEEIQVTM